MGRLNGSIARAANTEDGVKGRFWESRFKCQALLDEAAIAACMVYVDPNPIRAGLAETPERSDFASIQERIRAWLKEMLTTESILSDATKYLHSTRPPDNPARWHHAEGSRATPPLGPVDHLCMLARSFLTGDTSTGCTTCHWDHVLFYWCKKCTDTNVVVAHRLHRERTATVLTVLFCLGRAQAQEAETYVLRQAVANRETIVYSRVIRFDGQTHLFHVRDYYENGRLQMAAFSASFDRPVKEDYQCNYRSNTKEGPYTE